MEAPQLAKQAKKRNEPKTYHLVGEHQLAHLAGVDWASEDLNGWLEVPNTMRKLRDTEELDLGHTDIQDARALFDALDLAASLVTPGQHPLRLLCFSSSFFSVLSCERLMVWLTTSAKLFPALQYVIIMNTPASTVPGRSLMLKYPDHFRGASSKLIFVPPTQLLRRDWKDLLHSDACPLSDADADAIIDRHLACFRRLTLFSHRNACGYTLHTVHARAQTVFDALMECRGFLKCNREWFKNILKLFKGAMFQILQTFVSADDARDRVRIPVLLAAELSCRFRTGGSVKRDDDLATSFSEMVMAKVLEQPPIRQPSAPLIRGRRLPLDRDPFVEGCDSFQVSFGELLHWNEITEMMTRMSIASTCLE